MQRLGGLYLWGQKSQRERQFDFEIRITETTVMPVALCGHYLSAAVFGTLT